MATNSVQPSAVNRYELQVGQVPSAFGFQWLALFQFLRQFLLAGAAPLAGQMVLGHAVEILDTGGVLGADHRQHLGLRLAVAYRVAQDGTAQVISLFDPIAGVGRDEQPALQLGQVRFNEHRLAFPHTAPGEIA
jgi:hypothetical protein